MIAGIWEEGENDPCYSMLTTEPSDFVRRVHDRMPAVLEDLQFEPFLDGQLHDFGPSAVPLHHVAAENFLKPEKPRTTDGDQGFLF